MEQLINEGKLDKAKKVIDLAMTQMPLENMAITPCLFLLPKGIMKLKKPKKHVRF